VNGTVSTFVLRLISRSHLKLERDKRILRALLDVARVINVNVAISGVGNIFLRDCRKIGDRISDGICPTERDN
jgi:hypothetical protein